MSYAVNFKVQVPVEKVLEFNLEFKFTACYVSLFMRLQEILVLLLSPTVCLFPFPFLSISLPQIIRRISHMKHWELRFLNFVYNFHLSKNIKKKQFFYMSCRFPWDDSWYHFLEIGASDLHDIPYNSLSYFSYSDFQF